MDKYAVLKKYFGHDRFREGQEALIDGLLAGRDALGIMPTGGGKSLCYQIPALLLPGITLVISPLISLMKDQVTALKSAGVPAAFINSSLTPGQLRLVYRRMRERAYKIIYVAPERLDGEGFASVCAELCISLVAVDEAHCISQWGQDFRPSYLRIAEFLGRFPQRPVLGAFTATATEEVRRDITDILGLKNALRVVTGFDRPNLFFDILKPKSRLAVLHRLVSERQGKSGIVYCATRANVERVCGSLCEKGIAATRYHAGLSDEERRRNQEDFSFDRRQVMVATNAFGMGIDKSNVSYVIHYNMPKSLEAYYQEAGRAGRDGEPADCILLYSPSDIITAKLLIEHSGDGSGLGEEALAKIRRLDHDRLESMIGYCKTTECLRGAVLDYFGQSHPQTCGNCGNCRGEYQSADITLPAQMILSCIKRINDRLGYRVGAVLVTNVLRGSRDRRVTGLGLDGISTYGLLKQTESGRIRDYIEFLTAGGYILVEPEYKTLALTGKADGLLYGGGKLEMKIKRALPEPVYNKRSSKRPPERHTAAQEDLYEELKALRARLAKEENVPAYIIFTNAALSDMAVKRPVTEDEFLAVNGVGASKAARYGKLFTEAVRSYCRKS